MDDLQFNASLDALLASETLDGTTAAGDTSINVPQSNTTALNSVSYAPGARSGVTTRSSAFSSNGALQGQGMYTTAPVQYGATASNQPSGSASIATRGSYVSQGSYETGNASTGNFAVSQRRMSGTKRARGGDKEDGSAAVSDDEDDRDKRRQDRNLREQQRSHRITSQIDELRTILSSAQIRHKPDKFSTLVTVGDYIKQLQQRSAMLDEEHKKLIDTISRTNEVANEPHLPDGTGANANSLGHGSQPAIPGQSGAGIYNEEELVFVRNVDYKSVFFKCGIPLAVASIDGRFLDCNEGFVNVSGYKRGELLPNDPPSTSVADSMSSLSSENGRQSFSDLNETGSSDKGNISDLTSDTPEVVRSNTTGSTKSLSLFNLLSRECMEGVFLALSAMLKRPSKDAPQLEHKADPKDFWTGNVRLNRNTEIEVCFARAVLEVHAGWSFFSLVLISCRCE